MDTVQKTKKAQNRKKATDNVSQNEIAGTFATFGTGTFGAEVASLEFIAATLKRALLFFLSFKAPRAARALITNYVMAL